VGDGLARAWLSWTSNAAQLAADGRALSATTAPTGPVWALNGASAVVDLALRTQGAPAPRG
jgi:hypothetical protein